MLNKKNCFDFEHTIGGLIAKSVKETQGVWIFLCESKRRGAISPHLRFGQIVWR